MSEKVIVTLRSAPSVSVDVPDSVKEGKEKRPLKRSRFGAIRLFPGVPSTVTQDELEHIRRKHPAVAERLEVRPYVESTRVDRRGISEAELEKLAAAEGLDHLKPRAQVEKLRTRGKLAGRKRPAPPPEKPKAKRKLNGNGG